MSGHTRIHIKHPTISIPFPPPKKITTPNSDDCFDRIFALLPKRLKDPVPDLRPLLQQQQQRAHQRARAATAEGEEDAAAAAAGGVGGGKKKAVSFGPDVVAEGEGEPGQQGRRRSVGGGRRASGRKVAPLGLGVGVEKEGGEGSAAAVTAAGAAAAPVVAAVRPV